MQKRLFLPFAGLLFLSACATGPTAQDRADLANGYNAFSNHQSTVAEVAADRYIQKFPTGPNVDEAYYLRGIARAGLNQNDAAAADLRMAIQVTTRKDLRAKSFHTLGDMAYEGGGWSDARQNYLQALTYYDQPDAMTLFRIGAAFQAEGRWSEGRPYFARCIATTPTAATASLIERAKARGALDHYALQFGAYTQSAAAQTAAAGLKNIGITANVYVETHSGQTLYVIRAGSYRTLAEAEAAKNTVARSYPNAIVFP